MSSKRPLATSTNTSPVTKRRQIIDPQSSLAGMSVDDFNKRFHALPAEIQNIVWDYTAVSAVDEVPKKSALDFLYMIWKNRCGTNSAYYEEPDYSGTFYWAVKKYYGKSMFWSLFSWHRLEVLKRWKEMLAECRMPSEAEFAAWRETQTPSEEEYPMYDPKEFGDYHIEELKNMLDRHLSEDIRRETEWAARVKQYGGIEEAIRSLDLDEEFIKKVMRRKWPEEDHVRDLNLNCNQNVMFDHYEAFQRVVNEEYSGGGLAGANRVACLKAWKDVIADIEASEEAEEDEGPLETDTEESRGLIEWNLEKALPYEWGRQRGLKMVLPPKTAHVATLVLTG